MPIDLPWKISVKAERPGSAIYRETWRLSSTHQNAERVASGIGEHIQGLVLVVRPVIEQGRAQVLRSPALPFQFRHARYAEVVMHLLGHVICRPGCACEFFHLVKCK